MDLRHELGRYGEMLAEEWLAARGLRIVDRHYQTRYGEIDLIAQDKDVWVFIEVKTREDFRTPSALDAITPAKQRRLAIAAICYIRHKRLHDCDFRFDVVAIEAGRVEWIPNAFEAPENWTI
jgi:putative endonuclease